MPISVATPRNFRGLAAPLRGIVRRTLAAEGRGAGEIAVVLTGDAELRELNRRWRGIDRATDVLSFPYDTAHAVSGDLVISLDRLREQAKRYRVSLGRELARLVVHGALHLAGHDHHRVTERRLMRARENAVLRALRGEIAKLDAVFTRAARRAGTGRAVRGVSGT
jgi:probable rRNA maturation factor